MASEPRREPITDALLTPETLPAFLPLFVDMTGSTGVAAAEE